MSDAITRARQMAEQHPANELARFSLGKALFNTGDFAAAKAEFETALVRKPDWMAVRILLGKCELSLGNRALAREQFEQARELAIAQNHEGPREEMEQLLAELAERA